MDGWILIQTTGSTSSRPDVRGWCFVDGPARIGIEGLVRIGVNNPARIGIDRVDILAVDPVGIVGFDRVEYIVTAMDYLTLLRLYVDREGLFLALGPDEPVDPIVAAIEDVLDPGWSAGSSGHED